MNNIIIIVNLTLNSKFKYGKLSLCQNSRETENNYRLNVMLILFQRDLN